MSLARVQHKNNRIENEWDYDNMGVTWELAGKLFAFANWNLICFDQNFVLSSSAMACRSVPGFPGSCLKKLLPV